MLQDLTGRAIGYLRLSLTRACAMRCTYCRPEKLENPQGEVRLSPWEIHQLVAHLVSSHGLKKVRLTGGDPTSRAELTQIIEAVADIDGIDDLAMTTNGLTLVKRAEQYAAAGLRRVNVSLDSLDRQRYAELTGVDGLPRVLDGIDAAKAAKIGPIKINTVVVKGQNERDLPELVRFAAAAQLEIRFIELMPMGPLADQWTQRYVPESRMKQILDPLIAAWELLPQGPDSARRHRVVLDDGHVATIGFITPMSCNFCAECNRIRVAADGRLYPCLMDKPTTSLLPAVRPRFDGEQLDELLRAGLQAKASEHPHDGFVVMTHIGG